MFKMNDFYSYNPYSTKHILTNSIFIAKAWKLSKI